MRQTDSGGQSPPLPGDGAGPLNVKLQRLAQFTQFFRLRPSEVATFLRIVLQMIKLQRTERVVLQDFPVAANEGFVRLTAVGRTTFATDEIEIARRRHLTTGENRTQTDSIQVTRPGKPR